MADPVFHPSKLAESAEPETVIVPVPILDGEEEGVYTMALSDNLHEQNMSQLAQIGVVAQAGFATVAKAADYSYLQGKDLVSLTEALGAREVASKVNPAGPGDGTK